MCNWNILDIYVYIFAVGLHLSTLWVWFHWGAAWGEKVWWTTVCHENLVLKCITEPPLCSCSSENGSASTSTSNQNRPTFEVSGTCEIISPLNSFCAALCSDIALCIFYKNMDHQHLFTFPSGYGPFTLGIFDDSFDLQTRLPSEDNRESENRREREMVSRQRYSARQPRGRHVPRRQGTRHDGVPTLEGWDIFQL